MKTVRDESVYARSFSHQLPLLLTCAVCCKVFQDFQVAVVVDVVAVDFEDTLSRLETRGDGD